MKTNDRNVDSRDLNLKDKYIRRLGKLLAKKKTVHDGKQQDGRIESQYIHASVRPSLGLLYRNLFALFLGKYNQQKS